MIRKLKKFLRSPWLFISDAIKNIKKRRWLPVYLQAKNAFQSGQYHQALQLIACCENKSSEIAFLRSHMALYAGEYQVCIQFSNVVMHQEKTNSALFKNAFYLGQEALRKSGQYQQSQKELLNIPFKDFSNRYFRALRLTLLATKNVEYFEQQISKLPLGSKAWQLAQKNYSLLLRDLGEGLQAEKVAAALRVLVTSNEVATKQWSPKPVDHLTEFVARAEVALKDLKHCLADAGISFFLISGTLLGCVREGRILGHDKDIDVGVDEAHSLKDIAALVDAHPSFVRIEIPSPDAVYVRHCNGVVVDIFRHYHEDGRYYHGGIKARWWNTPFTCVPHAFLGDSYLVPENYDLYLTENYGDWRKPVKEFETFLDTPNMEVTNLQSLKQFFNLQAIEYLAQEKHGLYQRVVEFLESDSRSNAY